MLLTPHIVRNHEITEDDLRPIYIGSQQNLGVGGPPPLIAPPPAAEPPAARRGAGAPLGTNPRFLTPTAPGVDRHWTRGPAARREPDRGRSARLVAGAGHGPRAAQ